MRRRTFAIAYLPTFLGFVLGILLSTNLAYGFVGPGDSPGSLLAAIANPNLAGNQLPGRMAAMTAAKEMQSYVLINDVLTSRPIRLPPLIFPHLPRAASKILRNNSNRFAIGTIGRNSRTPILPYRKVLDEAAVTTRTLGGVHEEIVEYSISGRSKPLAGTRGAGVSRAWKLEQELVDLTGKGTRSWTKAQAEELLETGKVKGFEGHHINSVSQHKEWAGDPRNIEFLPGKNTPYNEHLATHGGDFKNPTTGKLIDRKKMITRVNREVARRLRDPIVQSRFARTFRMASKSRFARRVIGGVRAVSRIGSTITQTSTKIGSRAGQFVTMAAVGADFAFAGYGYYDTVTRYQAGRLDHDLMLAKLAVHSGEAGIGVVGVSLLFTPEPTGATKVAGVIIIVGTVALAAVDIALEKVSSRRTRSRIELLDWITREQRHKAVIDKLIHDAAKVHVRGD